MKKLLFVAVATLGFVCICEAQEVKFGAKTGVNFANINGDDAEGFDARTSFNIGALADIILSDKFSFQPELLYSAQGAKLKENIDGVNSEVTVKLDYINVPLIGKYYVADGFSIQAGPQIGFLASAKTKYEAGGESAEEDVKDQLKGTDLGLNLGLGYKLVNGLFFDGRYNLGLSNNADSSDGDLKNGVFQFSAGYIF